MSKIIIKPSPLTTVMDVHRTIPEFDEISSISEFEERISGKKSLVLVGFVGKAPAGYLIAYDRFGDTSFYCWLVAVNPEHRRKGLMTQMMDYLANWARKEGYQKINLKVRNHFRPMLSFLVKDGFNFAYVQPKGRVEENRILAEKIL